MDVYFRPIPNNGSDWGDIPFAICDEAEVAQYQATYENENPEVLAEVGGITWEVTNDPGEVEVVDAEQALGHNDLDIDLGAILAMLGGDLEDLF